MPLYVFYTMVQKSQKWPKTQIKGIALSQREEKGLNHGPEKSVP